jgi:hypothetical protein
MPHGSKVHPVFHASKLLPYHTDTIGDRNPLKPTPLKVKGHDEYLVEEVLDSWVHQQKVQYLIKWQGYDSSYNTWEPVHMVQNAWDLVQKFHKAHPEAVQPLGKFNATPVDNLYSQWMLFSGVQAWRGGIVMVFCVSPFSVTWLLQHGTASQLVSNTCPGVYSSAQWRHPYSLLCHPYL